MVEFKILKSYSEGVGLATALEVSEGKMLTNNEYDYAIQTDYERIKSCLPAWTSTHISYKAGSTEALIWNEGEKKKTKIYLPLNDGWYLPDEKYGIPNGKALNSGDSVARYLVRWQDRDYEGLLSRGDGGFGFNVRRYVVAYLRPGGRRGVAVSTTGNKTKGKKTDGVDWKLRYENLKAKMKQVVEAEG